MKELNEQIYSIFSIYRETCFYNPKKVIAGLKKSGLYNIEIQLEDAIKIKDLYFEHDLYEIIGFNEFYDKIEKIYKESFINPVILTNTYIKTIKKLKEDG